jgi:hypothetical protein
MDNLVRAIRTSFPRRNLDPFSQSYPAPLPIPDPLKKWPESTGIGGRFESEQVSGLNRNHCPLSTGIYTLHAVYSKSCLAPIERMLRQGNMKVRALYDLVKVRYVDAGEIDRFDPKHLSFFNINTKADLARARRLAKEMSSNK